jgi:hypothetical protein
MTAGAYVAILLFAAVLGATVWSEICGSCDGPSSRNPS